MATITLDFRRGYVLGERRESTPVAYQYDEGHVLEARVPAAVTTAQLHYWIRGMQKAEAYEVGSITAEDDGSYTITGNIPNKYFEANGSLRVYVVVTDASASIVTYEGLIRVIQREMPDDYVDEDPENAAVQVIEEAKEYAEAAAAARDAAQEAAESIEESAAQITAIDAELENIAEPYGTGRTGYFVGDIYEKDGELYVAQVAKIGLDPIDFTASDFYAAKLSQIVAGNTKSLAYPYDKDASYNTGDLAVYLGGLKQCKADGVTGAYDSTKWKDITINKIINDQKAEIDDELSSLKNDFTSLGLSVVNGALCVTYTE